MRGRTKGGEAMNLRELAEVLAKALVDQEELVDVREVKGEWVTVLEIRVAKDDLGRIIGRQGKLAEALRTILSAAGAKNRRRVTLTILE